MAVQEDILSDVERLGRLTEEQEDTLLNIAMRQDDYGWEPTNMLLPDLKASEMLMGMVERGFLDYGILNPGGKHEIVSLSATMKGIRYCAMFADEIPHRPS